MNLNKGQRRHTRNEQDEENKIKSKKRKFGSRRQEILRGNCHSATFFFISFFPFHRFCLVTILLAGTLLSDTAGFTTAILSPYRPTSKSRRTAFRNGTCKSGTRGAATPTAAARKPQAEQHRRNSAADAPEFFVWMVGVCATLARSASYLLSD